jgi:hypothetical protein
LNFILLLTLKFLNIIFSFNIDVNWIIFLSVIFLGYISLKKKTINLYN